MVVGTRRSARLKSAESNSVCDGIRSDSQQSDPEADQSKSISKSRDRVETNTNAAQGTCKPATAIVIHKGRVAPDSATSSRHKNNEEVLTGKTATSESVQSVNISPDTSGIKHSSRHGDEMSGAEKGNLPTEEEADNVAETTEMDPLEVRRLHVEIARNAKEVYKKESIMKRQMKGKPKSGRKWKTEQTTRFSDVRKDKPLKSSWQLKMAQKAEKLSVRKYQQELLDAKREAIELKKQRREEHRQRREENQKKSEVVQVIRNAAKLKRMKKKQLRQIEKR